MRNKCKQTHATFPIFNSNFFREIKGCKFQFDFFREIERRSFRISIFAIFFVNWKGVNSKFIFTQPFAIRNVSHFSANESSNHADLNSSHSSAFSHQWASSIGSGDLFESWQLSAKISRFGPGNGIGQRFQKSPFSRTFRTFRNDEPAIFSLQRFKVHLLFSSSQTAVPVSTVCPANIPHVISQSELMMMSNANITRPTAGSRRME